MMSKNQEIAASALAKAKEYRRKRQYEQALAACKRAIEADPNACEAYNWRWLALGEMMAPDELRTTLNAEVESFLRAQPETPEVLHIAYWGYMRHHSRTQNVPDSLFDKMLQYPGTKASLSALLGLAERSQNAREKWEYNQRVVDEFTISNAPDPGWYLGAYEDMLRLAEQDSSLVSDESLDELIEHYLQANLEGRNN